MNATPPCAYCGRQLPLRESHVLPRWMIERALAKSPTGRMKAALKTGWPGVEIGRRFPLQAVTESHEYLEGRGQGWVVVAL